MLVALPYDKLIFRAVQALFLYVKAKYSVRKKRRERFYFFLKKPVFPFFIFKIPVEFNFSMNLTNVMALNQIIFCNTNLREVENINTA